MRFRTCSDCGVPVAMQGGRVVPHDCAARTTAPEPRRPGTGRPQRRARDRVLAAAGGRCYYCGAPDANRADHVIPWISGGADTEANLAASCRRCNHLKGDRHLAPRPTIAIVGQIGAGKSTLAAALAEQTGWPILASADYRAAGKTWPHLLADLDGASSAIVESVSISSAYRLRLILRCALLVHVACPEAVRQERLVGRDVPRDLFRDGREHAHRVVDGTQPLTAALVAELVAVATEHGTRGPGGALAASTPGGRVNHGLR